MLKKNKKNSKPTIKKQKREIKAPLYKRENMDFFLTNGNATITSIEKFADDQLDYIIKNEEILHINKYYLSKGVRRDLYYKWVKKSEYLKTRHQLCLEILGLRREEVMAKNNPAILAHKQHQYDEGWAAAEKYHADLKNKAEDKRGSVIRVIMPEIEKVIDREKHKPININNTSQDTNNRSLEHEV